MLVTDVHDSEGRQFRRLALAALGVVFGDIGTSPLYAFKECLHGPHGAIPSQQNVLGLLSLIFWSVTLVVGVKYLLFIMRADNRGEGGVFALLALLREPPRPSTARLGVYALLGVVGAALLYGDGIVTPAISVLSAVEGLEVAAPALAPLVVPLTCLTLLGLFALQQRGTGDIGRLFGPVMLVWFATIAVLGAYQLVQRPDVLWALSPLHAADYFARHGVRGGLVLGSVVLAVTGGEALYADMGHFGVRPIRAVWFAITMPALLLCYFGQGALVLRDPGAADSPFFAMARPGLPTYALVGLASLATVIASQALISGAFSLTRQAIQLGFLPRLTILHTARDHEGQVYAPFVNWCLALACIALVLTFGASSRLASAYGIAVSGTMAITSLVFYKVMRSHFGWSRWRALPLLLLFLALDLPFLAANAVKLLDGGYVPVLVGAALVIVMLVWKRGQALFTEQLQLECEPLDDFVREGAERIARMPGTAVFVTRDADVTPPAMQKQLKAIPVLQEHVLVLSVHPAHVPEVSDSERLTIRALGRGFYRVEATYGFRQDPDVPAAVRQVAERLRLTIDPKSTTYYLRRETFLASPAGKMGRLSEGLFSFLSRNARPVDAYFNIPPESVFAVGAQFDL